MNNNLMETQAFKAQLDASNTSFKKGHEIIKKLMARAPNRHNACRDLFMETRTTS